MSAAYGSSDSVNSGASSTDTLVIADFTTSGSDRQLDVMTSVYNTTTASLTVTASRPGDTITHQRSDDNPENSRTVRGSLSISTTEPGTSAASITTVIGASKQYWGFVAASFTGVDQTTRIEDLTLNPTGESSVGSINIDSATGDLVCSFLATLEGSAPTAPNGGTETLRESFMQDPGGVDQGALFATAPGTTSVTLDWNGSPYRFVHYGWNHPQTSDIAPTAAVPSSGACINTYEETAVSGIVITEGSASLSSVATTCTSGCTLTYDTTGTSVTVSGNGTNAATLNSGANETEYNTVLDTLTMRGSTPDTTITVTVIPTDGTLNDNEQFTVYCDSASVTITGTNANVIASVESLKVRLLSGQTHDTISVNVVDDTGGTPLESNSEFIVGLSSYFQSGTFPLLNIFRRRRRS